MYLLRNWVQASWSAGQLTVHGDCLPKVFKIICSGKVFAWGYAAVFTPAWLCMAVLRHLPCSPVHSEAHAYTLPAEVLGSVPKGWASCSMPRSSLLDSHRLKDASPCYSPHPFHVTVSRKVEHGSQQKPNGSALGPDTLARWTLPTHLSSPSRGTGHLQSLRKPKGHRDWDPCGTEAHNNSPKRPPNVSGATASAKPKDELITAKHKGGHGTIQEAQTTTSPSLQLCFAPFSTSFISLCGVLPPSLWHQPYGSEGTSTAQLRQGAACWKLAPPVWTAFIAKHRWVHLKAQWKQSHFWWLPCFSHLHTSPPAAEDLPPGDGSAPCLLMFGGARGLEGHQSWAGPNERAVELERGESVWERLEVPHAQLQVGPFTPAQQYWELPGTLHSLCYKPAMEKCRGEWRMESTEDLRLH